MKKNLRKLKTSLSFTIIYFFSNALFCQANTLDILTNSSKLSKQDIRSCFSDEYLMPHHHSKNIKAFTNRIYKCSIKRDAAIWINFTKERNYYSLENPEIKLLTLDMDDNRGNVYLIVSIKNSKGCCLEIILLDANQKIIGVKPMLSNSYIWGFQELSIGK